MKYTKEDVLKVAEQIGLTVSARREDGTPFDFDASDQDLADFANAIAADAEAKLASAEPTTTWKPIDTAPRNNARLLYIARFSPSGELLELDCDGAWKTDIESWEMPHIKYSYWETANTDIEEPTHWAYQDEPIPTIQATGLQIQPAPDVQAAVAAALEKAEAICMASSKGLEVTKRTYSDAGSSLDATYEFEWGKEAVIGEELANEIRAIPRDTSALDEYKADIKRLINDLNDWFEYEVEWSIVKELKAKYNL